MTSIEWLKQEFQKYGSPSSCEVLWETFDELIEEAQEMNKAERISVLEEIISRLEEDGLYALQGIKHTLENLKK